MRDSTYHAEYRKDVDGLRALAILPVVLFHAGAQWLPGGFVGVDIFFVISGFLITSVIVRATDESRFSLASFYVRRARRILPALATVIASTYFAGLLLLTPAEMRDLGRMMVATSASASNIALWLQNGYFDAALELKPLLMTWSLGIEEQFYLFWPLLMMFATIWRLPMQAVAASLCVLSFALAWWACRGHPSAAFYLLPTRAWELLLGCWLAFFLAHRPTPEVARMGRNIASLGGFAMIALSIVVLDRHSGVPGWPALLPCVGAALLLWAGEHAVANRVLASSPLVFVGLISYSLYLWHWPVLTLCKLVMGPGKLTQWQSAGAVFASFLLAWTSWRWIETPMRRPRSAPARRTLASYALCMVLLATVGAATTALGGFRGRVSVEVAGEPVRESSHYPGDSSCNGPGCPPPTIALWGDSQALALMPGVAEWAQQNHRTVVLRSHNSCPPLLGVDVLFDEQLLETCAPFNTKVIDELTKDSGIRLVIMAARWPWYGETTDFGFDRHSAGLRTANHRAVDRTSSLTALAVGLARSVAALRATGKTVILIGQAPELGFEPASCLTRRQLPTSAGPWPACNVSAAAVLLRQGATQATIEDVARGEQALFFSTASLLCEMATCPAAVGGQILYSDDNHLSPAGARYVFGRMGFRAPLLSLLP